MRGAEGSLFWSGSCKAARAGGAAGGREGEMAQSPTGEWKSEDANASGGFRGTRCDIYN